MAIGIITKDKLVDVIDTCRIFEASYDFWDETGDGWGVLKWFPIFLYELSPADVEVTLEFLLWFIRSSSLEIKGNYHMNQVSDIISNAGPGFADVVGLLLELSRTGAVDKAEEAPFDKFLSKERDKEVLLRLIEHRSWDSFKLLLTLGANPHHVYTNHHCSPVAETLLSLAMYSSRVFWTFRNILREIDLDVEDIARQELKQGSPLLKAGWQMETLSALLEFEFEPDIELAELHLRCDSCCYYIHDFEVQPYWQSVLESIKNGTYQQMSYLDTQDEQTSNSRSNPAATGKESLASITGHSMLAQGPALSENQAAQPDEEPFVGKDDTSKRISDRKEIWCIDCWYHYKETGHRWAHATTETESADGDDSPEDDFSPLLFNI